MKSTKFQEFSLLSEEIIEEEKTENNFAISLNLS